MSIIDQKSHTQFITFGGEARSGKGTSVENLEAVLEAAGQQVATIDQGQKFRMLAELALTDAQPMDDITVLKGFIEDPKTHDEIMRLRAELQTMSKDEVKAFLYRPAISSASGRIGRVPTAHKVTLELLSKEVEDAVHSDIDTVIIDGRMVERHGLAFERQGLGRFTMGWYFRCHADIAARRSLGMYVDHANMTAEERDHLLTEIIRISDRNRSDAMRDVNPMLEPAHAYHLDLVHPSTEMTHYGIAGKELKARMAVTDTSYTRSVPQMLVPVLGISLNALKRKGGKHLENVPAYIYRIALA